MTSQPTKPRITGSSLKNCTLHWAYLEFAIRSSTAKVSPTQPPSIPVSRNIIEAIRYSYDFLDAAAEFAYQLVKDGYRGDLRPDNWLTRYMDRTWNHLSLSDKLGFLSFSCCEEGFWQSNDQRRLFEDLQTVRNALTHPGIFGVETIKEFADYSSPALSSQETIRGKMRRTDSVFAEHPEKLSQKDAKKAVEIALRHAERFEQLFSAPGKTYFSRINPRTGVVQSPTSVLARMRKRYFDSIWVVS